MIDETCWCATELTRQAEDTSRAHESYAGGTDTRDLTLVSRCAKLSYADVRFVA